MIDDLCGNDTEKWNEVTNVSKEALQVRIKLWDAIEEIVSN